MNPKPILSKSTVNAKPASTKSSVVQPQGLSKTQSVSKTRMGSVPVAVSSKPSMTKRQAMILAALGLVLVALLAVLVSKVTHTTNTIIATDGSTPALAVEAPAMQLMINGQAVDSLEFASEKGLTLSAQPLSKMNASQITSVIPQGSNYLITFVDGSQTVANESLMKYLPNEVKFQTEYRREQ